MITARIFDCFMFHDEADILQCRLEELAPVVDRFIVVECGENHLGKKKSSNFLASGSRFDPWMDRIEYVWVDRLRATDPKEREHEHRECIRRGLDRSRASDRDIIIQSDADEIPRRSSIATMVERLSAPDTPRLVALKQTSHYFAVDWLYPKRFDFGHRDMSPAASRFGTVDSFWEMRRDSVQAPLIPDAGWHFSWLGGRPANVRKIEAFYHGHEIAHYARPMIESERNWREGIHVDGSQMAPIDVDETFPAFVVERRCPVNWFRPR